MSDYIPYFGVFITLLFSTAFAYAVGGGFDKEQKKREDKRRKDRKRRRKNVIDESQPVSENKPTIEVDGSTQA
jgi:hypothetical protein